MNFQDLIELLLVRITYMFSTHINSTSAHNLQEEIRKKQQVYLIYMQDLLYYAVDLGIIDKTVEDTKTHFYTVVKDYIINNNKGDETNYFEMFLLEFINTREENHVYIFLINLYDDIFDEPESFYLCNYYEKTLKKIGINTKKATITYEDDTTEEVEFYIK